MRPSFEEIALQRFGYGRRPGEAPPNSIQDLLDQVAAGVSKPPGFVNDGSRRRVIEFDSLAKRQREATQMSDDFAVTVVRRERATWMRTHYNTEAHQRVLWAVTQPDSFFERLVFFWADHFTVSTTRLPLRGLVGPYEAEAIRPFIAGDFRTLLRHAALHPAMLLYLDQDRSVGPNSRVGKRGKRGLNENLGREIIELHTLGVKGRYSQDDVRQFATLLTGVTIDEERGETIFNPDLSEPGSKTLLGRRYGGDPGGLAAVKGALDDLARHPSTAHHLAWKLAVHFLSDDPPDSVIQHMKAAYLESDTQLLPVYRALLEHPAVRETYGQKLRQPFDYLVAALRAALPPGEEAVLTRRQIREFKAKDGTMVTDPLPRDYPLTLLPLVALGQLPWSAAGPDGWPEGSKAWISPQGLTERIGFATRLARGPLQMTDPGVLLDAAFGEEAPDRIRLLLQETDRPVEARSLILASPEFQRR